MKLEIKSLIKEKNVLVQFSEQDKLALGLTNNTVFVKRLDNYTDKIFISGHRDNGASFGFWCLPNVQVEKLSIIKARPFLKKIHENRLKTFSIRGYGYTIGADPEIFVEDENGEIIPAFKFLGSKETPDKTAKWDNTRGYAALGEKLLYWDGFQAEFTTQPDTCLGWHTDSVQLGLKGLLDKARSFNPKAKLSAKTVLDISPELLQISEEKHVEFGCMPSYNIYGLKKLPITGRECPFRMAGGHIHFGIGKQPDKDVYRMVRALDTILGVACVSLFEGYDDSRRRSMYGQAGEYRLPPHGLEYRTLSNAWLFHPLITHIVFDLARKALMIGWQNDLNIWKAKKQDVVDVIQNNDVAKAREMLEKNKTMLNKILNISYSSDVAATQIQKVIMNGMDSAVVNCRDIENNWNLTSKWVAHSASTGKCVATSKIVLAEGKKVS